MNKYIIFKNIIKVFFFIIILTSCGNKLIKKYEYDKEGKLIAVKYLDKKGLQQGVSIHYKKGKLYSIKEHLNNNLNGKVLFYYPNGNLQQFSRFIMDKPIDTTFLYSLTKKYSSIKIYSNRNVLSKQIFFQKNGKKLGEFNFEETNSNKKNDNQPINRIIYFPNGKINLKESSFCLINYLNKTGTKVRLIPIGLNLPLNETYKYTLTDVSVYILNKYRKNFNLIEDLKRKIIFDSNLNQIIFDLKEGDYHNNKVTLCLNVTYSYKKDIQNTFSYTSLYTVQLIKGDLSRWHNVHGITN